MKAIKPIKTVYLADFKFKKVPSSFENHKIYHHFFQDSKHGDVDVDIIKPHFGDWRRRIIQVIKKKRLFIFETQLEPLNMLRYSDLAVWKRPVLQFNT